MSHRALFCSHCQESLIPTAYPVAQTLECFYCQHHWIAAQPFVHLLNTHRLLSPEISWDISEVASASDTPLCPCCDSVPLISVNCGQLEAWRCLYCEGFLFSKTQLEALIVAFELLPSKPHHNWKAFLRNPKQLYQYLGFSKNAKTEH